MVPTPPLTLSVPVKPLPEPPGLSFRLRVVTDGGLVTLTVPSRSRRPSAELPRLTVLNPPPRMVKGLAGRPTILSTSAPAPLLIWMVSNEESANACVFTFVIAVDTLWDTATTLPLLSQVTNSCRPARPTLTLGVHRTSTASMPSCQRHRRGLGFKARYNLRCHHFRAMVYLRLHEKGKQDTRAAAHWAAHL